MISTQPSKATDFSYSSYLETPEGDSMAEGKEDNSPAAHQYQPHKVRLKHLSLWFLSLAFTSNTVVHSQQTSTERVPYTGF